MEVKSVRNEVSMCTKNPRHESESFEWIIDEFTSDSRLGTTLEWPIQTPCKAEFKLVAEFREKYPTMTALTLGLQRTDDWESPLRIDLDLQLANVEGDVYCTNTSSYTSPRQDRTITFPCFKEVFTRQLWSRMTVPKSFSYDGEVHKLKLHAKRLIGSFGSDDCVYILPNDKLVVKGKIGFNGCCFSTQTQQTHTVKLLEDFRVAFESGLYTDVELRVGDEAIRAHRFVLSARSPVFRRMLEHNMQEKRKGVIMISDFEKPVVEALMRYMYTGEVRRDNTNTLRGLYAAAHMYDLPILRQTTVHLLESGIDDESVCKILEHASLYEEERLKKSAVDYIVRYFARIKPLPDWESLVQSCPDAATEVLEIATRTYF